MNTPLIIILAVVAAVVLWVVVTYNGLIRLRNRMKEAFSGIDVQLKRRYDLIPNLVNTVKGYAAHERGVFEKVTEARTRAMAATGVQERAQAENMLTAALKSLFAVSENYPDLKASENFLQLQHDLSDTENKIQEARNMYNNSVRVLNTKIESFPPNIIAGMFRFKQEEFFELEEPGERSTPEVKF